MLIRKNDVSEGPHTNIAVIVSCFVTLWSWNFIQKEGQNSALYDTEQNSDL